MVQAVDVSADKIIFNGHVLHGQSRMREILRGTLIDIPCDNY